MWSVALKSPHGTDTLTLSETTKESGWKTETEVDINAWINSCFGNVSFDNWIVYNDEVPGQHVSSTAGHCKGILMWNEVNIMWLIHSCPNFPENLQPISNIPESACIYGQSFIFLQLPIVKIQTILTHLKIMNIHVYMISPISQTIFSNILIPSSTFDVIKFTNFIWHIAKSRKWGEDLFDDGLESLFGGGELVETWMRPRTPNTSNVDNLEEIKWPNGKIYTEEQDHSKFGFSLSPQTPWTYIGDINHMRSQSKRGGGGIVVIDESLWKAFYSLVYKR